MTVQGCVMLSMAACQPTPLPRVEVKAHTADATATHGRSRKKALGWDRWSCVRCVLSSDDSMHAAAFLSVVSGPAGPLSCVRTAHIWRSNAFRNTRDRHYDQTPSRHPSRCCRQADQIDYPPRANERWFLLSGASPTYEYQV